MGFERNAHGQHAGDRIDHANSAVPVADVDSVQLRVVAEVVRVLEPAEGHDRFEGSAVINPNPTVTAVGDKQEIGPG